MLEPASVANELVALGLVLLVMALSALICHFIKIAPFLGYLVAGIILQNFFYKQIVFVILSKIGIILLFFHIGSVVSWKGIISTKNLAIITFDFLINFMAFFIVLILLGYPSLQAGVIATILYPTSSVVTIGNLIQQRRSGYPETEVIVWLMVGEDLVIVMLMAVMTQLGAHFEVHNSMFGLSFILVMVIIGIFFSRRLSDLYLRIPKEAGSLFLFGSAFTLGILAYKVGLSEALGAFLFGMWFSKVGKIEEVEKQLGFLRELGVAFFFFLFGFEVSFKLDPYTMALALGILAFSIGSKWLTGTIGGKLVGLGKKAQRRLAFSIWTRGEFSMLFLWMFSDALPFLWFEALKLFVILNLFLGLIGLFLSSKR